uniref:Lipoprotein n=1 Tax=myxobacterium MSr12020 TaxID=2993535 RepID=A0A9E8DB44_9BACT|nr:hypothetical protein [myxobacterium MSr12020]
MLGNDRLSWALALATTVAVGCGGGGEAVSSGSGGGGGQGGSSSSMSSSSSSSSSSGVGGGASCPTMEGTVLAVRQLYFGEGNSGEWKKVGYNLDDKVSTGLSKDLCQPNAGGSTQTAYPDGEDGIDNSFGKNLLPTILSLYPKWVEDVNNGIQNGNFTALMKLMCLPPEGDVPQLTTKLFGATKLGSTPKWDGTDKWPVEPGLLNDPMDPESASILFQNSSVIGATFDAGKNATFILSVPVRTATESTSIKLTLYSAKLTMTLSDDRKSATAGMIGGVLNTEEFVAEIKKIGALLKICDNPLFDNLVLQVRQASDIMSDGTQDPSKTCDGITMGLGFEMVEAQRGDVGEPNQVGMACP